LTWVNPRSWITARASAAVRTCLGFITGEV
jgi:hypothetical protein